MELRPYQRESVDAMWAHLRERRDNPCVVLPTAAGKSVVLAEICRQAVTAWNGRVLVLAHVQELVEQNSAKLQAMLPSAVVGIHSAGLRKRDYSHQVIAAGIQSVYRKACDLGRFNLIVIDEAHLLPPEGEGMYRAFIGDAKVVNPEVRVIGLTATPYRMSSGDICGPENILNHVCHEVGVRELIDAGFLSPLISMVGVRKADVSGLHLRGGEFVAGEAEELMDADALVKSAVAEIVAATADRQACLIFCAGVKHAQHVVRVFREEHGLECGLVDGGTPTGERARLIARFRRDVQPGHLFAQPSEPLKYLANVGVLTTGFDAPGTDCVVMLRPTMSAGLMYQMVGRGFRLAPGKENCLVLDFAGNLVRHGPVDMLKAGDRPNRTDTGEAPARECPEWVCPEHLGYARDKFVDWWSKRSNYPPPRTVRDAVAMAREGCLAPITAIRVKQDANGYDRVIAWAIGEKPEADRGLVEAIHNTPAGEPWPVGTAILLRLYQPVIDLFEYRQPKHRPTRGLPLFKCAQLSGRYQPVGYSRTRSSRVSPSKKPSTLASGIYFLIRSLLLPAASASVTCFHTSGSA